MRIDLLMLDLLFYVPAESEWILLTLYGYSRESTRMAKANPSLDEDLWTSTCVCELGTDSNENPGK